MISLKEIQYIKSTSRQIIIVVRNIIAKKRKTGNTDAGFPTTDWKLFSNHVKIYTIVNLSVPRHFGNQIKNHLIHLRIIIRERSRQIRMEIFDIIDENGNPTGKTVERSIAHAEGIRHRTAHIWIIRRKNGRTEILLQKRSRNKDSFPGKFDTSSAGHIQAGDEPLESALRELKEELGIHAVPEDLQFCRKIPDIFCQRISWKMFRMKRLPFVYIYDHPVEIDRLTLQKEEVEEVQWFDLEETYQQCRQHRDKFCVPLGGLQLVREFIKNNNNNEYKGEKQS